MRRHAAFWAGLAVILAVSGGTLLGVLVLHEVRQFISWHWERDELNFVVVGTLLIAAVLLNRFLSPRAREE